MGTVLVTGATGTLGEAVVPLLVAAGHDVRAMTRRPARARRLSAAGATPVVADLLATGGAGADLREALRGVDHVLHLASSARRDARRTEVDGTAALLAARHDAAPQALVTYLSIVGCDRTPLAYYRAKTDAEGLVRASPRARVVRATQFHALLASMVKVAPGLSRAMVPAGWLFQPVDVVDVAAVLAHLDDDLPAQIGGPEVITFEEVARRQTGLGVLAVPVPGRLSAAVRGGSLLAGPEAVHGTARFPRCGQAGR